MKRIAIIIGIVLGLAGVIGLGAWLIHGTNVAILQSEGHIANRQRSLIIFTAILSLFVVVPVFFMAIFFSIRYRDKKQRKAAYKPDWDHNPIAEIIWWGVPIILITTLAIITWKTSHELDPYQAIQSDKKPLNIQVIAQDWKWLFIYPDQKIASMNHVYIPEKTPVVFHITSDAAMNSFWVPQLGGQIYAMAGMQTKLNLIADKTGDYQGSSANISGEGFASMRFTVTSTATPRFDDWVRRAQHSSEVLDQEMYDKLAKPSIDPPRNTYRLADTTIYDTVIAKYMTPVTAAKEGVKQ